MIDNVKGGALGERALLGEAASRRFTGKMGVSRRGFLQGVVAAGAVTVFGDVGVMVIAVLNSMRLLGSGAAMPPATKETR